MSLDGSPEKSQPLCPIKTQEKAYIGVFEVSISGTDEAHVTLSEEECLRQLGMPRRRTRPIGLLRPWNSLRILLNGRSSSQSDQFYCVREYHVTLCAHPAPDRMQLARLLDLQEYLF
jgi:hypothetical protein